MEEHSVEIVDLGWEDREDSIELVNQFFKKVNALPLDGVFTIMPRAATKFVDLYLKLSKTDKVYFRGVKSVARGDSRSELLSLMIARVEEKPFLKEGKTLYIDIAVTKQGKKKRGYMGLLVADVEVWAQEHTIPTIELRAIKANEEAMEYWNKKGFTEFYVRFRKTLVTGVRID